MLKKLTALLLVLVLVIGLVPAASAAQKTTVDSSNVSIEGTNGFGSLLSQEISESQTEAAAAAADYPGGYTVTDLEIVDGVATVTYDSMEEATLVVALYTEDGMRMVTSAQATVTPDETTAAVIFEGDMPEYFLASAYLLDSYDLSPLCAAYDTPMYTREMQELLASTVDDYDPEKVLNLDGDETTNFAVYADSTIVIEAMEGKNTVASIDEEHSIYVIRNADEQFTSLVEGNIFVYPYAENEILIVKIADIQVDGATVTIAGAELSMEEAFSAVKIEGDDSTENMVVDEDSVEDGVVYEGISDPEHAGLLRPMDNEIGAEISKSAKFKVDKDVISKGDATVNIAGSVEFSVKVALSYYISATRQYVDFRVEHAVAGAITLTGKIEHEWRLCKAAFYPIPCVDIAIEPTFKVEVSGAIEFSATLTGTIGFTFDGKHGLTPLNSTPQFDPDVKAECTIFFGFDLKPQIEIAEGCLAEFVIELPIGVEFKVTRTGNNGKAPSQSEPTYHTCARCLDIETFFKIEITVKLQFLKCKWLTIEGTPLSVKFALGHAYFSFDHLKLGLGLCPYLAHRLTVVVLDENGKPVNKADVTVDGESKKADDKGSAVFYLTAGSYAMDVSSDGLSKSSRIQINEAQKVTIKLCENDQDSTDHIFDKLADILKSEMVDFENTLDTSLAIYNGHTYTLFDGKASSWDAAREYCETLGGHLATITSAEENAFLYNYMLSSGYSNVYWGLTDQEKEGVWEWCTGEPVTYTNWAADEPNDDITSSPDGEDFGMFWDGKPNGYWNDGQFGNDGEAFLCEWDFLLPEAAELIYDDHTYLLIHTDVSSWDEAEAYCESMGGHLATITSAEENEHIYSYIVECGYRNAFFGLTDRNSEGTWEWCTGEPVTYTNWPEDQPSDNIGEENYGMYWDYYPNGEWNDGNFTSTHPFICEWDSISDDGIEWASLKPKPGYAISPNAVYPGDYGTEITDTYVLKTASFKDLVPNEQYVLLAMASIEVEDPLAGDNLLFIDQAAAAEDGTLVFQYVQRTTCDISYVAACGASHKNLKDAEITFPEMIADGELQIVDPVVVYDGVTLTEGRDYVIVGRVDFTEPGEYTCSIRGIHSYTGLVECPYTVAPGITEVAAGWSGATQWTLTSDGTLTFYGEGNMKNYGYDGGQPWLGKGVDITSVIIEEGVTAVGTGAFRNLTTLESVTLPETSLTRIDEAAFYGCTSLTDITIPDSIYTIWAYVFKNCSALESIKLPRNLIKIDQGAFENCTALPYVYIPGDTEIIGSWSFKGCTGLVEAEMTWANATEIREGAFKNCSALTAILLPMDVQIFGDSAFYGIGAESFTVPETVTAVGPWCFARAALTKITFPGDAPAFGEGAFNKIALTAFYPSGNSTWTADIMQNYGGTVTWTAK